MRARLVPGAAVPYVGPSTLPMVPHFCGAACKAGHVKIIGGDVMSPSTIIKLLLLPFVLKSSI